MRQVRIARGCPLLDHVDVEDCEHIGDEATSEVRNTEHFAYKAIKYKEYMQSFLVI